MSLGCMLWIAKGDYGLCLRKYSQKMMTRGSKYTFLLSQLRLFLLRIFLLAFKSNDLFFLYNSRHYYNRPRVSRSLGLRVLQQGYSIEFHYGISLFPSDISRNIKEYATLSHSTLLRDAIYTNKYTHKIGPNNVVSKTTFSDTKSY